MDDESELINVPEPTEAELLRELELLSNDSELIVGIDATEFELDATVDSQLLAELHRLTVNQSGTIRGAVDDAESRQKPALEEHLRQLVSDKLSISPVKNDGEFIQRQERVDTKGTAMAVEQLVPSPSTSSRRTSIPCSPRPVKKPTDQSTPVGQYRHIIESLKHQISACGKLFDACTSRGLKLEAALHARRKQAFELDLLQIRAKLKANEMPPQYLSVDFDVEDVGDGPNGGNSETMPIPPANELHLYFSQLQLCKEKQMTVSGSKNYQFKLSYEPFGEEWVQKSMPFTSLGLTRNLLGPIVVKLGHVLGGASAPKAASLGSKLKDLRFFKAVEHKKLKVELVEASDSSTFQFLTSWFSGRKNACLCGSARLDALIQEPRFETVVDLVPIDTESGKKKASSVATVRLTAVSASAWSGNNASRIVTKHAEKWVLIPQLGHCTSDIFPGVIKTTSPPPPAKAVASNNSSGDALNVQLDSDSLVPISLIHSFEVIEYELELMQSNEALVLNSPELMDRQVALEGLRDQLQSQVEYGELSLPDYLATVRKCIDESKMAAVKAKREGQVARCRGLLKHIDLMKKEVSEAVTEE